jgi:hypothetical protein
MTIYVTATTADNNNNFKPSAPQYAPPPPTAPRYFNGRPVKAKYLHLPDEVLLFKEQHKQRIRKARIVGALIGIFVPGGPLLGALCGYAIAKSNGKKEERKIMHAIAQRNNNLPPTPQH